MIYLGLSILLSSLLYVIFKLFDVYKINTLQAIVVNYLVAFITGIISSNGTYDITSVLKSDWLFLAMFMGILFITIFNVMALTAQRNGLSVASVASKMSLVIPVIAGFTIFNEEWNILKAIGIKIALAAVYFTTVNKKSQSNIDWTPKKLLLPLALFVGSGIIDTVLKILQNNHMSNSNEDVISATIFSFAFIAGSAAVIYRLINKNEKLEWKSLIGGIVLGIPNFFSIVVILKALNSPGLESTFVYPINHVGTVVLSTMFGLFLFKEKLKSRNVLGIILAIIAIVFIAFAKA